MLPNDVVFGISAALALCCFVIPAIYKTCHRFIRVVAVASIYIGVFAGFVILDNVKTGVAVVVLGVILAAVSEALTIDFELINAAKYPKNQRCY